MIDRLRKITSTELFRSSFYSALATSIKIFTAFAMSKIVATYLGPEGMGLIGQLSSFVTVALIISGGAFNQGIIKYIAEFRKNNQEEIKSLVSTALKVLLILTISLGVILMLFSKALSVRVLLTPVYQDVFILFGITVSLYGLNTLALSILNGYKNYKKFNLINIVTSLLGLLVSYILIKSLNIKGALYALVINQSITFIATVFFLVNEPWFRKQTLTQPINIRHLKNLSRFGLMALIAAVSGPFTQIFIRTSIIEKLSLSDAGIWEAINRISAVFLLFVTTSISTYYLPRLSEINNNRELRYELKKVFLFLMPVVTLVSAMIYLMRFFIIKLLFTSDFAAAGNLFLFQLIGDVLKICSWLLATQMIAKAMTVHYVLTELIFATALVFSSTILIKYFGLVGATYAYAINYALYLLTMTIIFRKILIRTSASNY